MQQTSELRVLCIGDPHFTEDIFLELNTFISKILELIDKLKSEPQGLKLVVVLGDILDKFEKSHTVAHTQAMKFLYEISIRCQLLVIIGNHDRINNSVFLTDESPFWACHHWPNTLVADVPLELKIQDFRFIAVPYVFPGRLEEALERIPNWRQSAAIFGHQEIRNCSLGAIKSEQGDLWPDDYPVLISGHIHEYEKLANNMIYVGTPRMKTFGDHREKTVSLFTFSSVGPDTDSKNKVEYQEQRIDLGLPKKTSIKLTINQVTGPEGNVFLKLNEDLTGSLKIFVQGTQAELSIGMKHPVIKHLKSLGVKIIPDEIFDLSANSIDSGNAEMPTRMELQKKIWDRLSETPDLMTLMKELISNVVKLRIQKTEK